MPLDLSGDELHIIPYAQSLEELDDSPMDDRNGKSGPTVVQRVSATVERKSRYAPQFKPFPMLELPGLEFLSLLVNRSVQMPAREGLPVIHPLEISRHALLPISA